MSWTGVVVVASSGIVAVIVCLEIYNRWSSSRRRNSIVSDTLPEKELWTLEEISRYDGNTEQGPILIGINGKVYNVASGREYYGKTGGYHIFAGKDATRLLAKNILDLSKDDGKPLTETEVQQLGQWQDFFDKKYGSIGSFKPKNE